MDCREFRNKHVAFVDDVLPAIDMQAMERHRAACTRCSRQDTMIRRSLMLVSSLQPIEPSPDFMAKLNRRLDQLGPETRVDLMGAPRMRTPSVGTFAAFAAGVVAVAYMAVETSRYFAPDGGEILPIAVTASVPALEPGPSIVNAAFVASVPTGIPVWPAMLMVGQTPMQLANLEFHETR
jgi:hypothetical protein